MSKYRPTMYHGLHFSPMQQPPIPTVGQPEYVGQFMAEEVSMTPYGRGQFAPVYMVKKEKWHPTMVSGAPWHPVMVSNKQWHPVGVSSKPMQNYGITWPWSKKKDPLEEEFSTSEIRVKKGSGGYVYKQDTSGNIWIWKKPGVSGQVNEKVPYNSASWKAITAEIGEHPTWKKSSSKKKSAKSPAKSPNRSTSSSKSTSASDITQIFGDIGKEYVKAISPQIPAAEYEIAPTVTVTEEKAFPWGAVAIAGGILVGVVGLIVVAAKTK